MHLPMSCYRFGPQQPSNMTEESSQTKDPANGLEFISLLEYFRMQGREDYAPVGGGAIGRAHCSPQAVAVASTATRSVTTRSSFRVLGRVCPGEPAFCSCPDLTVTTCELRMRNCSNVRT
ncbi:hypothetical protein ILYODFUR_030588 [Ilyodon furcidens]|uniref:Uncharacterized protein n=1 Tax=Ilyodon furcidens TaxID=33524 RepID=A0ABV0U1U1_9TELE